MKALRIGLVHPYMWPDVQRGGERYLDDLSRYLVDAGHAVEIITGGGQASQDTSRISVLRCRPRARAITSAFGFTDVDAFGIGAWPALVRHRYDVVQALVPSGAVAARLAGQRTIFSIIGYPTPDHPSRGRRRALRNIAFRSAHVLTAPSIGAARATTEITGRPTEPLWPGVWLDQFPLEAAARAGAPRVLYPSDLSVRRKGLDVLLAAVSRLLPRHPDLRLVLSGTGDARWAFDRLPDEQRQAVTDATEFGGLVETAELVQRYQSATVTVLPAKEEAFGMVLIESLACGTPVIGCTGSGMTEIVADPASGRLCPFGDPDALADALSQAIEFAAQPETPATCRRAAARFGWAERIGPVHEDLYARVVDGARGQKR